MTYLFENNDIIISNKKPVYQHPSVESLDKIGFCFLPESAEKEGEELALLEKIVGAVGQEMGTTALINLNQFSFSLTALKGRGVDFMICFANYQLTEWSTIDYKIGKAFRLSEVVIFPTASLSNIAASQDFKNQLWKFLKDRKE